MLKVLFRGGVLFAGVAVGLGCLTYTTKRNISYQFQEIFSGFQAPMVCHDRELFKKELQVRISNANPTGGIFVCGRINSGKTTTVSEAIRNRKYIAYINWRNTEIENGEDLNEALKKAFKIKDFKDYLNTVPLRFRAGYLLGGFLKLFPHLDMNDTEMKELLKTQEEVERVLTFAASKRSNSDVGDRPVIFIDEIGSIRKLLASEDPTGRQFLQWMIKLSKDLKLCDIVLASNNGLMMRYLTEIDPLYFSSVVIPDFNPEEVEKIRLAMGARPLPPHVQEQVGGHASHIIQLFGSDSKLVSVEKLFNSFYQGEKMKLKSTLNSCRKCKTWMSPRLENCIETQEFHKIMNQFKNHLADDPEIPWDTLERKAEVPSDSIYELIRQDVLFYNPGPNTLKSRTKLFLHVYDQEYFREKKIGALNEDIRLLEMIMEDQDTSTEEKKEKKILANFKRKELENLQA